GLEQVLAKALAKAPEERYASCGELLAAASEALGVGKARPDRRPLALAAVGIALVAAGVAAFFLTRGGGAPPAGTAVRIDPRSGRIVQRLPAGNDPEEIAVGSGRVWTANFADGTVSKIDPASSTSVSITVNGAPLA